MDFTARSTCRSCGSAALTPVLSLGEQYVSNFVDNETHHGLKAPLDLVLCDSNSGGCGLLQLRHTVSADLMFKQYWYRSGINTTMAAALQDIASTAEHIIRPSVGEVVLDIGCNDGTLLRSYKTPGLSLVGFEPATNLIPFAEVGTTRIINDYFTLEKYRQHFPKSDAKLITTIAMLYDLEDPNKFVDDVVGCLQNDGVWIIQMNYLPSMLNQNAFDNICVPPDTVILGDNKPISAYRAGDNAFGINGTLSKVTKTMQRQYEGNLVRIEPMYLEPIRCTPEHPVMIAPKEDFRFSCGQLKDATIPIALRKFNPIWRSAKHVKRGDYVLIPKLREHRIDSIDLFQFKSKDHHSTKGLTRFSLNPRTAWLLGLYVAEGSTSGHNRRRGPNPYVSFSLHRKEQGIARRIHQVAKSLGYAAQSTYTKSRPNNLTVRIVCANLARALHVWCGKSAGDKHVPDFIMTAPKYIKRAFLRGLFDGDGYIRRGKIHLHSASKALVLQTQLLAASLGGMLGISYVKAYPRLLRGKAVTSHDSWQLRGTCKEILGYRKTRTIAHHFMTERFVLVPVKGVTTEEYSGTVHNIETEQESYLLSNAIVHNCHEHLEYYSMTSLRNLLAKHDLEIFDAELNNVNGGSFRVYVKHNTSRSVRGGKESRERLARIEKLETDMRLTDKQVYLDFASRVKSLSDRLYQFVKSEHERGKRIYVYGASTKGNTLLQSCNLDHTLIDAAADRNPDKWGKKTVGTLILIVSEEQARADRPDYFLVLPWHFLDEFVTRERPYLTSGGKFIVPLPHFRLVQGNPA